MYVHIILDLHQYTVMYQYIPIFVFTFCVYMPLCLCVYMLGPTVVPPLYSPLK